MKLPLSHSEQAEVTTAFTFQRMSLAACILLAPLSITLYLVSWPGNLRAPLMASAMAGPTGNTLHFIGAIAASFFLPLGYLGMSLLGMRRAPWLATLSAALSLVGWIPWAALMGLDALAYDITQMGSTGQFAALWTHFNGDARSGHEPFRERNFENAVGDTISFTYSIFKRGTGSLFTLENQSVCAIMGGGFGREQSMGGALAEPLRVNSRGCEQIHLGKRFRVTTPDLLEAEA